MGHGEKGGLMTLFSRTTLAHAVAGSVGSILAMVLTYPLDRVRTYKQMQRSKDGIDGGTFTVLKKMLEKEGFFGIYDGLWPMLVALGSSNFVYFYWFTALKAILQYLLNRNKKKIISSDGGPLGNLVLASIAGTLNVLMTTPVWVAYTRLAVQNLPTRKNEDGKEKEKKYNGVWDAMKKIAQEEGPAALWSGMGPSLILVSNPSVQFASYEYLKKILLKIRTNGSDPVLKDYTHFGDLMEDETDKVVSEALTGTELTSFEYLILGAVAKMIATVVTYPLQIAQTRLRAEANNQKMQHITVEDTGENGAKSIKITTKRKNGTMDCLRRIYKSEGFAGLYRGMEAKLLQTCLTSAFMFAAYEEISAIILRFFLWRKFSQKAVA